MGTVGSKQHVALPEQQLQPQDTTQHTSLDERQTEEARELHDQLAELLCWLAELRPGEEDAADCVSELRALLTSTQPEVAAAALVCKNEQQQTLLQYCCTLNYSSDGGIDNLNWGAEAAAVLLEFGAPLDVGDGDGWTPVHHAAFYGASGVLQAMLGSARMDSKVLNQAGDVEGRPGYDYTPLLMALPASGPGSFTRLSDHGLDLLKSQQLECFRLLVADQRVDVNYQVLRASGSAYAGATVLHFAAARGLEEAISTLLRRDDLKPNTMCITGPMLIEAATALHFAATANKPAVVKLLLADPRVDPNKKTTAGFTPLHNSANTRALEAMEALLECPRVEAAAVDAQGRSALEVLRAACRRQLDSVGNSSSSSLLDRALYSFAEGTGWVNFAYLLMLVGGFGMVMSNATFWLCTTLIIVEATLSTAVRPALDALLSYVAEQGVDKEAWLEHHGQSAYMITKCALALALLVVTSVGAACIGNDGCPARANEATIGVAAMILVLEGAPSAVRRVRAGTALFPRYTGAYAAGRAVIAPLDEQLQMVGRIGAAAWFAIPLELLRVTVFHGFVVFDFLFNLFTEIVETKIMGRAPLPASLPTGDQEPPQVFVARYVLSNMSPEQRQNVNNTLNTYSGSYLAVMQGVFVGLLVGGNFGEFLTRPCFWICWLVLLIELSMEGIYHALGSGSSASGRRYVLVRSTHVISSWAIVCLFNFVFELPLLAGLVWLIGSNRYLEPGVSDADCNLTCQSRCLQLLVAVAAVAATQTFRVFTACMIVPVAVLVVVAFPVVFIVGTVSGVITSIVCAAAYCVWGVCARLAKLPAEQVNTRTPSPV